jgi:hypothetical protein
MPHESHLGQELGVSLEIFEEMLAGDSILQLVYQSLDKEEAEIAPNCHGPAVYRCIDQFVDSELDLINQDDRGLGRKDDRFPRLAPYIRERIESFTAENLFAFKLLLFDLVRSGYDFMVLMECTGGKGLKKPVISVFETLFLEWTGSTYDFKFETLGPAAGIFRDKYAIARLKLLAEELASFGLFDWFAQDIRLQHIFRMYIVAGLVLRLAEAYFHQ